MAVRHLIAEIDFGFRGPITLFHGFIGIGFVWDFEPYRFNTILTRNTNNRRMTPADNAGNHPSRGALTELF